MSRYLVRVELADRPGALGAVASRIGAVRGDVVGVEILDRRGGRALDDFLVDVPEDAVDLLRLEIEEVDGAVVQALHGVPSTVVDARREAYDGAAAFVAERSPQGALQLLVGLARRELAADWAAVVDTGATAGPRQVDGNAGGFTVLLEEGPAPSGPWLAPFGGALGRRSALPTAELAWAAMAAWDLSLVVGRPGRPFADAERGRLVALARLGDARWAELSASRAHGERPARVG
jgi:hypothetical protein